MGLSPFRGSSCSRDTPNSTVACSKVDIIANPNPNKYRWEVLSVDSFITGWCVVVLKYSDCTNYEGKKVLVYDNMFKFIEMKKAGAIDPHFDDKSYSPVARFEPTDRGIRMAKTLARSGDDRRKTIHGL